ncbi:hypothetical protein [Comamonas resistens]|uniref:Uncharacterized protein n=1 Tax=Comamonas resistens TaxID=3046670 RepID=A0ABY8SKR0_9BURK|nr:hypothetical protein [Comamonas resistens]MDL5035055.1 hypothetical protein [Comamonas resistens]WHS63667.1 hypothetical protein QMY55_14085 [Comamonas resistens]
MFEHIQPPCTMKQSSCQTHSHTLSRQMQHIAAVNDMAFGGYWKLENQTTVWVVDVCTRLARVDALIAAQPSLPRFCVTALSAAQLWSPVSS